MTAPCMNDAEKREKMRQIFGGDFKNDVERELTRVTKVEQPAAAREQPPEWMQPEGLRQDETAQRLTLWLEAGGVNMDKIVLVEDTRDDEGAAPVTRLAVVTAGAVRRGTTLFEVPAALLIDVDSAISDPDVGRDIRIMASNQPGAGFETFAIASMLAAERVRRGSVRGRLRRQDGGAQVGAINFARDGKKGEVLPEWKVESQGALQSNRPFSPMINALPWIAADECRVDTPEQAAAVESGAALIARLIEPVARRAWMKATQRVGAAQSTSDEDVECRAVEALYMAMEAQLEAPPPLGQPDGTRQWGDGQRAQGPAICPLATFVLPPSDIEIENARAASAFNALLGRPTTGNVDIAIRCVADTDLPAGTVIVTDLPGAASVTGLEDAGGATTLRPKERVRVVAGTHDGRLGTVLTLRPKDGVPLIRLDGDEKQLVAIPAEKLRTEAPAASSDAPRKSDGTIRKQQIM